MRDSVSRAVLIAGVLAVVATLADACPCQSREQLQRPQQQQQQQQQDSRSQSALSVGDEAPMFTLKSVDGTTETDTRTFRGKRPLILFFGSYT